MLLGRAIVVLFLFFTWAGFLRRVMNFWAKALGPAFFVSSLLGKCQFLQGPNARKFSKVSWSDSQGRTHPRQNEWAISGNFLPVMFHLYRGMEAESPHHLLGYVWYSRSLCGYVAGKKISFEKLFFLRLAANCLKYIWSKLSLNLIFPS